MNTESIGLLNVCPHCGADARKDQSRCWLCQEDKTQANPYAVLTPIEQNQSPAQISYSATTKFVFTILLYLSVALTVMIGMGLAMQDRGLLIPYSILVGPALLITSLRGWEQSKTGIDPARLFVTYISSIATVIVVGFGLIIALVVLLFIICISTIAMQPMSFR